MAEEFVQVRPEIIERLISTRSEEELHHLLCAREERYARIIAEKMDLLEPRERQLVTEATIALAIVQEKKHRRNQG